MSKVRLTPSGMAAPVTINDAVSTFTQPTVAGGGGVISTWRDSGGFCWSDVDVQIHASAACVLNGALGLYGEKDNGEVGFIGYLNGGEAIRFQSATVGFNQQLSGVGIFKRLLVGGVSATVSPTSGTPTFTAKVTPILVAEK